MHVDAGDIYQAYISRITQLKSIYPLDIRGLLYAGRLQCCGRGHDVDPKPSDDHNGLVCGTERLGKQACYQSGYRTAAIADGAHRQAQPLCNARARIRWRLDRIIRLLSRAKARDRSIVCGCGSGHNHRHTQHGFIAEPPRHACGLGPAVRCQEPIYNLNSSNSSSCGNPKWNRPHFAQSNTAPSPVSKSRTLPPSFVSSLRKQLCNPSPLTSFCHPGM